jgi:hypothetical protein
MDPEFIEVVVREVHRWTVCPCRACGAERTRRLLPSRRVVSLSPPAASLFGYVPPPRPSGSLARELTLSSSDMLDS